MNWNSEKDVLTEKAVAIAVTFTRNLLRDEAFSAIKVALNCREEACSDNQKCDFHHHLLLAGTLFMPEPLILLPDPAMVPWSLTRAMVSHSCQISREQMNLLV